MKLLTDITSSLKKGFVYSNKGDEVKLIGEYGDIVIVEDKKGNRFAVKKENVK